MNASAPSVLRMIPCRCAGRASKAATWRSTAARALVSAAAAAAFGAPYFLVEAFHITEYAAGAAFLCAWVVLLMFPQLSTMSVKRRLTLERVQDDPFAEAVFVRCNQVSMATVFAVVWVWTMNELYTPQWSALVALTVAKATTGIFKTATDHIARIILMVAFFCKRRRVVREEARRAQIVRRRNESARQLKHLKPEDVAIDFDALAQSAQRRADRDNPLAASKDEIGRSLRHMRRVRRTRSRSSSDLQRLVEVERLAKIMVGAGAMRSETARMRSDSGASTDSVEKNTSAAR